MLAALLATLVIALDGGAPDEAKPAPAAAGPRVGLHAALEAEVALFPSGFEPNGADVLVTLRPVAGLSIGEDFSLELGPTFRLRLVDTPADNRATDFGGVLRRADWDEPSDFGQLLSALRIGHEGGVGFLTAGPVRKKTLGLGHLVSRYSNQDDPDYHPASATGVLSLGPVRAEVFASDVLGARLFAGDLAWDLGRTFSGDRQVFDRYVLALELAHDFGLAGLPFRPDPLVSRVTPAAVTLLQLDGSATLVRTQSVRFMLLAGVGTRAGSTADLGFAGGLALDVTVAEVGLSLKVEVRKQAGGYRLGYFGPGYELARFADLGFSGPPRASLSLPDGWGLAGELRIGFGATVSVDVAAEHFFFGRTDLDATVDLALLASWLTAQARVTVVGLGQLPRTSATGGLKVRLLPALYLVGSAGTVFFPQPDGTLLRGLTASVGAGVDIER
jgi:hypothetical protein